MKKWLQLLVLITSISATSVILASGGMGKEEHEGSKEGGKNLLPPVTNAKWKAECSSCHLLYHPGLLPEKSWKKLMTGLDNHFGENASLDAATQEEIKNFLVANSADKSSSRRSQRINQSIPASSTPLRITDTQYFIDRHEEISATTFKRKAVGSASNCAACHKGAEQGNFSESQIKIPR